MNRKKREMELLENTMIMNFSEENFKKLFQKILILNGITKAQLQVLTQIISL